MRIYNLIMAVIAYNPSVTILGYARGSNWVASSVYNKIASTHESWNIPTDPRRTQKDYKEAFGAKMYKVGWGGGGRFENQNGEGPVP